MSYAVDGNERGGLTRRGFLWGVGILGVAAAAGGLAGCATGPSGSAAEGGESAPDEVTQRLIDRGVVGANLPEAAPIAPVDPPSSWDAEADVVVVGLGGGGLVAAGWLGEQGLSVIGVEKQSTAGGATRHACDLACLIGGTKPQIEAGFPGFFNGDTNEAIRYCQQWSGFTSDEDLIRTLADDGPEAFDWFLGQEGVPLVCLGIGFHEADVVEGRRNHVLGLNDTIDALETVAVGNGADLRFNTPASALVVDDGRVVGVQCAGSGGAPQYFKGAKGVILVAGGFGMNKDLIKAYLPSAYEGAVQGGPMPFHTGEVFRMGLGVGADFDGYDSWSCWEGAIDEATSGGDGQFWHYFHHGERQLFHNPWLLINSRGKRLPYYSMMQPTFATAAPCGNMGDLPTVNAQMATVGHRAYSICDSKFPEEVFKKNHTDMESPFQDHCRIPIHDEGQLIENGGLVSADWLGEVEEAVERGAVKKADTLDGLAEQLGLNADILKDAVERYNGVCDKGVDEELAFPYDPSWLSRIDTPPYYAAIVGGQIGKTLCGLRVNADLQVCKESGESIPGLYAGYSTYGEPMAGATTAPTGTAGLSTEEPAPPWPPGT